MWLLLSKRALGRMEQIAVESTLVCMSQSSVKQIFLTASLEIVYSFVVKNNLKMPCLFFQGSGWVSSTFSLLYLDD